MMKLFYNGNIRTPHHSKPTAMAIDHGIFVLLGSDKDLLDSSLKFEQKINLRQRTIWPGLIDAHVHLGQLADSLTMVDCETKTMDDCLDRIRQAASQMPEGAWIRGHGWNQNLWEAGYGNANLLDRVTAGHPAYLTAKSLHAAWANSEALARAGVNSQYSDPAGGTIQRDASGQPTGILFEAGAMRLIESIIPSPTQAERVFRLKTLLPELWQMGLVGVHDFDGMDCWLALQECSQESQLDFRVCKNVPFEGLDAFIQAGLRTNCGDDFLHVGQVKLFSDGALGPQTAAMKQPYTGTHEVGALLLQENEIVEIGKHAISHGLGLTIHAIGDLANHIVLNAFAKIRAFEEEQAYPHLKHRIEHVQIIDPADLHRLAELDIVASIQPVHAPSDMIIADRYLGDRSTFAYAYQSLIKSGATFVLGSDAPVEPINPFLGIHAAVTRQNLAGEPTPSGWHPEQRLSLSQALEGFSSQPAAITERGNSFGQILPGRQADFIILEQDPFLLAPSELYQVKPLATFIKGKSVYQSVSLDLE
jgi:predicted amidohydrolase YtcJ